MVFVSLNEGNGIIGAQVIVVDAMFPVCIFRDIDERVAVKAVIGIIIRRIAVHGRDSPPIKLVESAMIG